MHTLTTALIAEVLQTADFHEKLTTLGVNGALLGGNQHFDEMQGLVAEPRWFPAYNLRAQSDSRSSR